MGIIGGKRGEEFGSFVMVLCEGNLKIDIIMIIDFLFVICIMFYIITKYRI